MTGSAGEAHRSGGPRDLGDGTAGERRAADLARELAAERAARDHWRRVAARRSEDLERLMRQPAVRALLGAERRLAPVRARLGRARARARAATGRAGLALAALGRGTASAPPEAPPPPPLDGRRALVVSVGALRATTPPGVEVVEVGHAGAAAGAIARGLEGSSPLVGLVAGTSEAIDPGWFAHLATAIRGDVAAATPMLVHPRRPWSRATPHDGRVRALGLSLVLDGAGALEVHAEAAGRDPDFGGPPLDVDAASAAAVLFDRAALERAGGLAAADDLDAAVVEACARLRAAGGRVVAVPAARVVDHRSVRDRRDLWHPVATAGSAWVRTVERAGPTLLHVADPGRGPRAALTVAAPSRKVAPRWGDWHLARAMGDALERRGWAVLLQTADAADHLAGRACDLHLVVRGLVPVRRAPGQRHVLWIISHPEAVDDEELDAADLVLAASPRYAAHLRTRTATPVEVLLQATDPHRFAPRPPDARHRHPVTVVAKTRDVARPAVLDALAAGLRPAIYGSGWGGIVDSDLIVAEHVANELLPSVYSSAGVVLNDHWATMRAWGFVSNRIYDVLACGTPVISDPVPGLADLLEGTVPEYEDVDHLAALVADVQEDPQGARARAERGRRIVLRAHTFDHRAAELLDALERHAPIPSHPELAGSPEPPPADERPRHVM